MRKITLEWESEPSGDGVYLTFGKPKYIPDSGRKYLVVQVIDEYVINLNTCHQYTLDHFIERHVGLEWMRIPHP